MRYFLQNSDDHGKTWVDTLTKKKTKADIEQWVQDNVRVLGLDWRVGYVVRFRDYGYMYRWVKTKDGTEVKP